MVHLEVQADESSLKTMLEEDTFLRTRPFDVLLQHADLGLGGVGDGQEEVEEGTDCNMDQLEVSTHKKEEVRRTEFGCLCFRS